MLTPTDAGVVVDVRVVPRGGHMAAAGVRGGALLIRLTAPPVEGAANAQLVERLSRMFGLPKRAIAIIAGERSRAKRVLLRGLTVDDARTRIEAALGAGR